MNILLKITTNQTMQKWEFDDQHCNPRTNPWLKSHKWVTLVKLWYRYLFCYHTYFTWLWNYEINWRLLWNGMCASFYLKRNIHILHSLSIHCQWQNYIACVCFTSRHVSAHFILVSCCPEKNDKVFFIILLHPLWPCLSWEVIMIVSIPALAPTQPPKFDESL